MYIPTKGYIEAAKQVTCDLKGIHDLMVNFYSTFNSHLQAFIKFPINDLTVLANASWIPHDQHVPVDNDSLVLLEVFKSISLSGFILFDTGFIH